MVASSSPRPSEDTTLPVTLIDCALMSLICKLKNKKNKQQK
jgi:hypothetical protein